MKKIKVPDLNDSIVEIDIKERTYYLTFSYNSECDFWVMGVQNSEQETIIAGIKMVANMDLFAMFRYLDIPQVPIVAYMANGGDVPTRESFNNGEAELIYES